MNYIKRFYNWTTDSLFRVEIAMDSIAVLIFVALSRLSNHPGDMLVALLLGFFISRTLLLAWDDERHFSNYLDAKYGKM